jgi:hypothetical protein
MSSLERRRLSGRRLSGRDLAGRDLSGEMSGGVQPSQSQPRVVVVVGSGDGLQFDNAANSQYLAVLDDF